MSAITTPALVVLLGSTPALVELELCHHLLSLGREDCRRVAFVHIDTDEEPSELVTFHQEHQGLFRRFRQSIAVPVDIDFAPLPKEVWHTYIPSKKPQHFANGAGGIRNNGHVAAAFDLQKVEQVLESAIQAIETLGTRQNEQRVRKVHANIVAFLGGGTGSGIIGDVAVMVRQMLISRRYVQRINLFCILPDPIQGADNNDMSRRRSNATACLLELIALSLVANTRPNHAYQKYLLDEYHDVPGGAIANEIYLIGRTSTGSVDGAARIVGLDLFQRITDASGVGHLEHSEWMGRLTLGARDDRQLPAVFGTSCPLEVFFPLHEAARAYAQVSASYLLPHLVNIVPPPPNIEDEALEEWRNKWRDVATLEQDVQGKPLAVRPSIEFTADEFADVGPDTLDSRWAELRSRQGATDVRLEFVIQKKRVEEERRINTTPRPLAHERLSPVVRKINHLYLLRAEYRLVRDELKRYPAEQPLTKPEWHRSWLYSVPYFGNKFRRNEAERLRQEYNSILESHASQTRYNFLLRTVEELLELVEVRLDDALRWFSFGNEGLDQAREELADAGYGSAAWRGALDRQHPHQRHIFDLASLQDDEHKRNLASERLYLWATAFPRVDERAIRVGIMDKGFINRVATEQIDAFVERCTAYLVSGELEVGPDAQQVDVDLEFQSKERLVDRVVAFFYEHYTKQLSTRNLFELLKIGSGLGRAASVSDYLYEHLYHIRGLTRSLIGFQQTLWSQGAGQLYTNVYLGMRWDDGTQQRELEQAIGKVGTLTNQNQTPKLKRMDDPHHLQVSYGQHGISLSTVQEFYRDSSSMMADYIRHQGDWYGNQQPVVFPNPSPGMYGSNSIPVHNCGELERLTCDRGAFGYSPGQPHAGKYGTNLIGRVIREPEGLGNTPTWSAGSSPSGAAPGTSPGAGGSPWSANAPNWGVGQSASSSGPGTAPGGAAANTPPGGAFGGATGGPATGSPGIQPPAGPAQGGPSNPPQWP